MDRKKSTLILVLTLSLCLAVFGFYSHAAEKKADKASKKETTKASAAGKAAVVNGTTITESELDVEAGRYQQQFQLRGQNLNPEQVAALKKKVLESLINRELLFQESKKQGIKISDNDVTAQINEVKSKLPNEMDYSAMLEKLKVSESNFKAQIGKDMAIQRLVQQEYAGKVSVTPDESKAFYDSHPDLFKTPEMVRASHILIKADQNAAQADKDKARQKLVDIEKRIKKGEEFGKVAKEVSECPSSAKEGDLDFFAQGQMVPEFDKAAFALKPGQVSDIVQTQFGYHLIKVTDKKEASLEPYDKIKEMLENRMKQDKVNQQVSQLLEQLRSKAKIERFAAAG